MKTKAVLLADADPGSGRRLAGFLSDRGVPTLLAAGSAEVLALLRSQSIGLAVLDTNLEGRDGWGLRTRVADLKPLLPIVMMTAAIGQLACATAAGVDALVEKPVDPDTMLRIVRELLAQSTESRLRQVFVTGIVRRYVPQTGDHFLDALRLRSTTPLATPELEEVLARCVPSWQTVGEMRGDHPGGLDPAGAIHGNLSVVNPPLVKHEHRQPTLADELFPQHLGRRTGGGVLAGLSRERSQGAGFREQPPSRQPGAGVGGS